MQDRWTTTNRWSRGKPSRKWYPNGVRAPGCGFSLPAGNMRNGKLAPPTQTHIKNTMVSVATNLCVFVYVCVGCVCVYVCKCAACARTMEQFRCQLPPVGALSYFLFFFFLLHLGTLHFFVKARGKNKTLEGNQKTTGRARATNNIHRTPPTPISLTLHTPTCARTEQWGALALSAQRKSHREKRRQKK